MTRATHACLACPGRTRHDDQVCAACRRLGVHTERTDAGLTLRVPIRLTLVEPKDVHAPTLAEVEAGTDLTRFLATRPTIRSRRAR